MQKESKSGLKMVICGYHKKAIRELFDIDRTVVTKHIKNIYSELELFKDSTSANFALVQKKVIEKLLEMYYALI